MRRLSSWRMSCYLIILLALALQSESLNMTLSGSSDCVTKKPLCFDIGFTILTGNGIGLNTESDVPVNAKGGWGYISTEKEVNSAWFNLQAAQSEPVLVALVSNSNADLDFVLWGPFDTPDQGCGSALTSVKVLDAGWKRGPSLLMYENDGIYNSLEKMTFNVTAGKYYTLLINDQSGNTSLRLDIRRGSNSTFNCSFLTDVTGFRVNGTGNATSYGTAPVVGEPVTVYFTGYFLDSRPNKDTAKFIPSTDNCLNGSSAGADRAGQDLGPGDQSGLFGTEWNLYFVTGGSYKLCYQPAGFPWKQMGNIIDVVDLRPRPPVRQPGAIPDALETDTDAWFDFEPKTATRGGPVEFTFRGFKIQSHNNVLVKAVVEDCQEEFPSVAGMVPQNLTARNTAKFSLSMPGRYRMCMKHRLVWEISANFVQVVTPDLSKPYWGYSSCEQLLANNADYCGCFYNNATAANASAYSNVRYPAPVQLPVDYPMSRALGSTGFPPIDQGCCMRNTPVRSAMGSDKLWGVCSDPSPSLQPNQCAAGL